MCPTVFNGQSSEGGRDSSPTPRPDGDESVEVLLVGTLGGGGIHHYVENLDRRLDDTIRTTVYDMYADPKGEGVVWFVRSLLLSILAAVRFPFRRRPDLVHVHASQSFSFYRATPYVLVAALLWRRPVIFHVHGSSFDEFVETNAPFPRAVQNLVFGQCDRIIVLSAYWHRILSSRVDEAKLVTIPNAVAVDDYDPRHDGEVPRIVFISNMIQRKGVSEFIEAIDHLTETLDTPFEVEIAGAGPLAGEVEDLAGRHEHVTYHGFVSEADKRQLLSTGDVFVLPSHAEGLPIAMLEGMAGGNAIVSTTVGSIPEVIDSEGGILVDPGDSAELASAIETLIRDPRMTATMGRHNRELVLDRYTWVAVTEQVSALYRQVVAESGEGSRPHEGALDYAKTTRQSN